MLSVEIKKNYVSGSIYITEYINSTGFLLTVSKDTYSSTLTNRIRNIVTRY